MTEKTRTFESGATRNSEEGKLDYEGFLSPLVLRRYAEYLNSHRQLEDGTTRDSDNWQQGMPLSVYMKSLWRHLMAAWTEHRGARSGHNAIQVALCAVIFNASGYLHELLVDRGENQESLPGDIIYHETHCNIARWGCGICSCGTSAPKIVSQRKPKEPIVVFPDGTLQCMACDNTWREKQKEMCDGCGQGILSNPMRTTFGTFHGKKCIRQFNARR